MTEEDASLANIETCRRINRSAAARYAEHGVSAEDAAIAAIYSAHDLAMHTGRNSVDALDWMRNALDVMEGSLLLQVARKH